jgi:hypothetical protein
MAGQIACVKRACIYLGALFCGDFSQANTFTINNSLTSILFLVIGPNISIFYLKKKFDCGLRE